MSTTLKLRAECGADIDHLLELCPPGMVIGVRRERLTADGHLLPDEEAVITVADGYGKNDLMALAMKLEDGHVMVDTLEAEQEYTGERKYIDYERP